MAFALSVSSERHDDDGRTRDQPRRGRSRSTDFRALRRWPLAEADREDVEQRGRTRSSGLALEPEHDPRQPEARHRDAEQRALHRAHGLEPTAFCERPGYRETFGAVEPADR